MTPFLTPLAYILFPEAPFSGLCLKPSLLCPFWEFLQGSGHRPLSVIFLFGDSLVPSLVQYCLIFCFCCDRSAELGSFCYTADLLFCLSVCLSVCLLVS